MYSTLINYLYESSVAATAAANADCVGKHAASAAKLQ